MHARFEPHPGPHRAADGKWPPMVSSFVQHRYVPVGVMMPIEQLRCQARHQSIGDLPRTRGRAIATFRQHASQRRHTASHHVHRMGSGRQGLQRRSDRGGQAAQGPQLRLVGRQVACRRQVVMNEKMGDFLELAGLGHIQNVVAAIMSSLPLRPTVHNAVLPATTPDNATGLFTPAGLEKAPDPICHCALPSRLARGFGQKAPLELPNRKCRGPAVFAAHRST